MDVTLERVQFKFASIIGELCSKPVILSQFAIWVDLRLAEYKLKGSISLDCSGDKPDPDWLKGMKEADGLSDDYPSEEHQKRLSVPWHVAHNSSVSSLEQDNVNERLGICADQTTIVIKNDSDDDGQEAFPTGLHAHKGTNFNHTRKRSRDASGLDRGEDGLYSVIHHKVLKSPEPTVTSQTSNQSLMSIIGGQDSMHEASPVSIEDAQRDIDLAMAIQMQENHHMGDNASPVTYIPGRPSSHATSTVTKSSHNSDSSFNSPPGKPGMWLVPPGRYRAEEAQQAGMVELMKGRGVYLYPQLLSSALGLCNSFNRSGRRSHGVLRDGQPAARFLLSVFFSREKIVNGTLSQTADHMEVLDPVIIQVITETVSSQSTETVSSYKEQFGIKQEPMDDVAYEWNSAAVGQNVACKIEATKDDDATCLREDYANESQQIADHASGSWLERIMKKEPVSSPAAHEPRRSYGSASQTLLSLLEKGRDASSLTCRNAVSSWSNALLSKDTNPPGMTLAALLTRTQKFTPGVSTCSPVVTPRMLSGSCSLAGTTTLTSSPDGAESGHGDNRGQTRLRRLLQGEDITGSPLEPFKKRCEDLETARIALKQFIAKHTRINEATHHSECTPSNLVKGLHLKCIFCDYTRTIQEDKNFILHVFSHANNGELDQYNSICPRCTVSDLTSTEFVCHALSHCIVTLMGPKS